jgi:hypothetical protein
LGSLSIIAIYSIDWIEKINEQPLEKVALPVAAPPSRGDFAESRMKRSDIAISLRSIPRFVPIRRDAASFYSALAMLVHDASL